MRITGRFGQKNSTFGADLVSADLRFADLQGANLQGADLRGSDLQGADLRGAKMKNCDLRGADLSRVDLQDANLAGAWLDFSVFPWWCKPVGSYVTARFAAEFGVYFCMLKCDDPAYQAARKAVLPFAWTSDRAAAVGLSPCEAPAVRAAAGEMRP
jgi:hypothetical protein